MVALMLYGRRRGRGLKESRQELMGHEFPKWELRLENNPVVTIETDQAVSLEIGFGSGEHLALQAATFPGTLFIGCEPFINGIAAMVEKIHEQNLTNVRIFAEDVFLLLPHLPRASLDHIFVLFPDPWPKKRHHKRRLLSEESVKRFLTYLKPGGEMLMATDHGGYQEWIQGFWQALPGEKSVSAEPPALWTTTRYQDKAQREGRKSLFFHIKKQHGT